MSSGRSPVFPPSSGPVLLSGHLRKLKTTKKKFFVLRGETSGLSACLEYYDSKKKFENKQPPKRSISLHSCFNINKRVDTKYRHVIALYTKDECFCLILDSEKELDEWLNSMLLLQGGDVPDGEQPKPTFEHVWQVTMQKKGLGERKNIQGPYRLCLTDRTLSLVKVGARDNSDSIIFSLMCIRRCGYMDRIFYMEVGRSSVTGVGEFWMETEDNNIAYNMHRAILNSMSNSNSSKEEVGPRPRGRSSSANEASKPISVLQRRQTHMGQKIHGFSPSEEQKTCKEHVEPLWELNNPASAPSQSSQSQSISSSNTLTGTNARERCDSLPSRARTSSEGHPTVILGHPRTAHLAPHIPRPHSMYGKGLSYSPPVPSMPISPASGACSTDSAGSSLSMDEGGESILEEGPASRYGHSLTPDEPVILEENGDDYTIWSTTNPQHKYSPMYKSQSPSQSSYMEMYSPCGSSPGRGGAYMPMSPATNAHSHSRASSLVEEGTTVPDGYVPMAPVGDDGYVDMDPANPHNGHFPDDMSQHGGSSCSVTSGTPSTDLRFSEYHLDKVTSYLAPGEDLQSRPTRAYSVGSRPEPANRQRKNRLEITQQESRVRAFSVGSRSKKPEIGRLANAVTTPLPAGSETTTSSKSNSAPLLSSSWGQNSGCSGASERMEDLMELDFTRPNVPPSLSSPLSSFTQSHSQSHSYSTATDTSSYVDMSPGQPPVSTTAAYVDMSGLNKGNRNNNNNTITANHNHSHPPMSVCTPKPVITTLKPVEEAEGPYLEMGGAGGGWHRPGSSPKQVPSPINEDYMQMDGPPGVTRTSPVDLPQPRRPPEGYVEMSFKTRPSPSATSEQDYINMNMSVGTSNRSHRRIRGGSRKDKSRSQPIAIQAGSKPVKTPSFLPLNGSLSIDSCASTPASPPRATPTGSSATIFPFSLNSPQSPIKPFTAQQKDVGKSPSIDDEGGEYAVMQPTRKLSVPNPISMTDGLLPRKVNDINNPTKSTIKKNLRSISSNVTHEQTLIPITKRLGDIAIGEHRLVTASPAMTGPNPSVFKPVQTKPSSPKLFDKTPTPTPTLTPTLTPTPAPTPTPTLCPLDSEGYEKLQPGASFLHYARLDLPEVDGAPPVSPIPPQEGFSYAEIDFAKLTQN